MGTISVLDAAGTPQTIQAPLAPGRAADAASRPVSLSNEDYAAVGDLVETAPTSDTASSGLNGRLQRIAQRLTSLIALLPTSLGTKTAAASLAVTLASDGSMVVATGTTADAAYSGTGSGTIVSILKWIGSGIASLLTAYSLIPAPSTYRLLAALATTNGANIKGAAGAVKGIQGYNAKSSAVYLKLYNKATSPTVGTDTPVKTLYLPPTAAFAFDFGTGLSFATGIGVGLTGAAADNDATALTAGDIVCLNVDYH